MTQYPYQTIKRQARLQKNRPILDQGEDQRPNLQVHTI